MPFARDLLIAIAGAVLGGILLYVVQEVRVYAQERKGIMTGDWEQIISDPSGQNPLKQDAISCKQKGDLVRAEIKRHTPTDQSGRTWGFVGRLRDGIVFGHFWSKDPINPSFGTIFLRQTAAERFAGHYVRLHRVIEKSDEDTVSIRQVPLEWRRVKK